MYNGFEIMPNLQCKLAKIKLKYMTFFAAVDIPFINNCQKQWVYCSEIGDYLIIFIESRVKKSKTGPIFHHVHLLFDTEIID